MKKTYGKVLLVLVSILIFTSIVDGANNTSSIFNNSQDNNQSLQNRTSDTYRVLVDGYNGFYRIYRIYDVRTSEEITYTEYDNNTLNIRVGDTVIWSNEDPVEYLTIVSIPKLWENRTSYIRTAKIFSHKFNKVGKYDIYIRQHQDLPHQKIVVSSSSLTDDTNIDSNNANINKTIILRSEYDNYTDNATEQGSPKSKVVIKTYRKSKEVSGFGIIMTMSIILTLAIYTYKKRVRRK